MDVDRVRALARSALASIEANRRRIDNLNVYPVPDGDTGTNLAETVRSVVAALEETHVRDRLELAQQIARAALLGARGNSGVILSQIVRGAADVLGRVSGAIDADAVAHALRRASESAYEAMREPVEGTMLTAIRALAEAAERRPDPLWPALLQAGEQAVARTREQLDVLRQAGVVDAGAAGLVEIVRGIAAAVTGEPITETPVEQMFAGRDAVHQERSRYRYCTTFVVEGEALDAAALEAQISQLGDSLLVVGDAAALKIHVHTDDPGAALSVATARGAIDRVEIANMHAQTAEREQRLAREEPAAQSAVVAVVAGEGNRRLFESLGAARIVEGGQTMNPSAGDLVAALDATPGNGVIVLPNNANVVPAAEQAARLSAKAAEIVATETLQAGLAAMIAFEPQRPLAANAEEMRAAARGVATGEVTIASRDADLNGIVVGKGAYLGLADGCPVAGGADFDDVAIAVAERLLERLRRGHPELELEVQHGGQPHYPLLLSAE